MGAHHGGNENAVQGNVAACGEERRQQRGLPGIVVQPALECCSNGLPCLQVRNIDKLRLLGSAAQEKLRRTVATPAKRTGAGCLPFSLHAAQAACRLPSSRILESYTASS